MSIENNARDCDSVQTELVRLACDESIRPSEALETHLTMCPACRESLDASRDFVSSLREALEPDTLSSELTRRIRAEVAHARARRSRVRLWTLRTAAGLAAAAAIALVVVPRIGESDAPVGQWDLSEQEAATIVQAYAMLPWEGPEDLVSSLETEVREVAQTIEGGQSYEGYLPWGPEDDWDLPVGEVDSSARPEPRATTVAGLRPVSSGRA
jgi:hypothetical protein